MSGEAERYRIRVEYAGHGFLLDLGPGRSKERNARQMV